MINRKKCIDKMADRIPLIVNPTASQIQEVPDGDVVSLPNNDLKFGTGLNISYTCLLYTSPSPRDNTTSRMPSSA